MFLAEAMGVSLKTEQRKSHSAVFPDHSSFSVLRETPVAFTRYHFKKLKCYKKLTCFDHLNLPGTIEPRFNAGMDRISPQSSWTLAKGGTLSSGAIRSCAAGEAFSMRTACRARNDSVTGWDSGDSSTRDLARFKASRASSRLTTEGRFRNRRYARTRCWALCQLLS